MRMVAKILRAVSCTIALTFLLVTFTPLVRLVTAKIEQPWDSAPGDVLVVLGGSMLVSGTGPDATLGHETYLRCVYAAWAWKQQPFRAVVVTGDSGAGEAMASLLQTRGIRRADILIENGAYSTYTNALYTKRILSEKYGAAHLPEVTVLTSDFHSWRARRTFEHLGLRTRTIPVPDVIKQSYFVLERWPAFLLLMDEFAKDIAYTSAGKI